MADFVVRIAASGENLAQVTAELLALLTSEARVDARPVPGPAPDGSKTGTGMTIAELAVTGALSATTVRALASVLVAWTQSRSKRKLTLKAGDEELVIDGTVTRAQQAVVEKWMSDRG